ncbi:hypothetical protein PHYPSEUDO_006952 [Phytophthora pseudosyringae]|uniref:HSF-type DNA-binding domain-containing protein n=1 Tax=Phytophthora pseudosyringae TaxID=221518 RepID=A0A8T1VHT9_9STRA|nr:hypothetical protein PHYPSEUDO_006952 [Phytophthora pseudosyringae]
MGASGRPDASGQHASSGPPRLGRRAEGRRWRRAPRSRGALQLVAASSLLGIVSADLPLPLGNLPPTSAEQIAADDSKSDSSSTAPMPPSASGDLSGVTAKPTEVAPFLRSLRQMLDSESPRILRWSADGKAFEIHDMAAMMRLVLPKYFKHGKYTSFQRQLNYFSFRKWTKSKAVVCTFSNQFFQRDQPALSWRITRKKSLHAKKPERGSSQAKPIVIRLLAGEACSPASFPSPTDAHSLANALGLRDVYGEVSEITFHEPLLGDEHALDWVDVLYSSLEPLLDNAAYPSFRDHAFDYAEL